MYCFDRNAEAKARRGAKLIREGVATRKAVVSYQVVQEFFNIALRRFEQPMTTVEGEQYLTTVFRPMLSVHSSQALFAQALQLNNKHRLAWTTRSLLLQPSSLHAAFCTARTLTMASNSGLYGFRIRLF
ncbi:MAG TPA: hypothetical protein VKY85_21900 [Candidatus Angelobacter sp.]|nr:hypothetical protein [Candidatus Angelobacter sp.]